MSRIKLFWARVPRRQAVKSALLLLLLCYLGATLLPPGRIATGYLVLACVLVIPYLASDFFLLQAPRFVRLVEWMPLVVVLVFVFLRKTIASDFRYGLVFIAAAGLYLGAYFWFFSDPRFWAAVDDLEGESEASEPAA